MNNNFQHYEIKTKLIEYRIICLQLFLKTIFLLAAFLMIKTSIAAPTLILNAPDRISAVTNFEVNIGITGLDPADDLGAFSFDFFFTKDIANFSPSTSSFGDQLGVPTDPLETVIDVDVSDGGINLKKLEIFEVSLLLDLSSQLDDFTLFTVGLFTSRFSGPANKTLGITANNFVLSDALGNVITASNTSVGKGIVVVSEPEILLIITFGLAGIGLVSKKKNI